MESSSLPQESCLLRPAATETSRRGEEASDRSSDVSPPLRPTRREGPPLRSSYRHLDIDAMPPVVEISALVPRRFPWLLGPTTVGSTSDDSSATRTDRRTCMGP